MSRKRGDDGRREPFAIDRQCSPGRDLMEVGGAHDQRAKPPHLLVQQADGVVFRCRRSGMSWSRQARRAPRSCGRPWCAGDAFRGAQRGRQARRPARRLPNRPGRRRRRALLESVRHSWDKNYACHGGAVMLAFIQNLRRAVWPGSCFCLAVAKAADKTIPGAYTRLFVLDGPRGPSAFDAAWLFRSLREHGPLMIEPRRWTPR